MASGTQRWSFQFLGEEGDEFQKLRSKDGGGGGGGGIRNPPKAEFPSYGPGQGEHLLSNSPSLCLPGCRGAGVGGVNAAVAREL